MKIPVLIAVLFSFSISMAMEPSHTASKPATLMTGMGNHHHPIATKSPLAQKFFDQGLALMFGFNHSESISSFQRAAELDPDAAMPLWGIALALGPNYNMDVTSDEEKAAYDALQKALAVTPKAPENERAYIEALSKRYSNDPKPDLKQLAKNYANAMRELSQRYPDDLDAATLFAESLMDLNPWRLWNLEGQPNPGTEEIVAVLESVLKRDPNHPGANHYYVHAVEASANPARALPSAIRLQTLVPAAGHLVHMPAHVYIRTGDYDLAAKANENAIVVDEAYLKEKGKGGIYPKMYYDHNVHFLSAAAALEGRYAVARQNGEKVSALALPEVKEVPFLEAFVPWKYLVMARFNQWNDLLRAAPPEKDMHIAMGLWHYARGVAFAKTGKLSEAQQEASALVSEAAKIPADTLFGTNNTVAAIMDLATTVLSARMAAAKGDSKGAIEQWKKAVQLNDQLVYNEPPDWYYPIRESLGAALLMDGQAQEAETVFRKDLDINPRNGRSLFGLQESLKAQNKTNDIGWISDQFAKAWKNADTKLRLEDL
ncbi:MAG TPA: hypothetical protein VFG11_10320 [Acidobacteriota bacterium]|nr:hypothetical protein [Acidobacteriota bacterium]